MLNIKNKLKTTKNLAKVSVFSKTESFLRNRDQELEVSDNGERFRDDESLHENQSTLLDFGLLPEEEEEEEEDSDLLEEGQSQPIYDDQPWVLFLRHQVQKIHSQPEPLDSSSQEELTVRKFVDAFVQPRSQVNVLWVEKSLISHENTTYNYNNSDSDPHIGFGQNIVGQIQSSDSYQSNRSLALGPTHKSREDQQIETSSENSEQYIYERHFEAPEVEEDAIDFDCDDIEGITGEDLGIINLDNDEDQTFEDIDDESLPNLRKNNNKKYNRPNNSKSIAIGSKTQANNIDFGKVDLSDLGEADPPEEVKAPKEEEKKLDIVIPKDRIKISKSQIKFIKKPKSEETQVKAPVKPENFGSDSDENVEEIKEDEDSNDPYAQMDKFDKMISVKTKKRPVNSKREKMNEHRRKELSSRREKDREQIVEEIDDFDICES